MKGTILHQRPPGVSCSSAVSARGVGGRLANPRKSWLFLFALSAGLRGWWQGRAAALARRGRLQGQLCPRAEETFGSEQGTGPSGGCCRCRRGCCGLRVLRSLAPRVPPGLAGKPYLLVFGSLVFAEQRAWRGSVEPGTFDVMVLSLALPFLIEVVWGLFESTQSSCHQGLQFRGSAGEPGQSQTPDVSCGGGFTRCWLWKNKPCWGNPGFWAMPTVPCWSLHCRYPRCFSGVRCSQSCRHRTGSTRLFPACRAPLPWVLCLGKADTELAPLSAQLLHPHPQWPRHLPTTA